MCNLSEEQIIFLKHLSEWIDSKDNKSTIYQIVCIELKNCINKNLKIKNKQRCNILQEMLINEEQANIKGIAGPQVKKVMEHMRSEIRLCYKFDFLGKQLFKHINHIELAKHHLQTSSVKYAIPSDTFLDMEIDNMDKIRKIELLLSILDEWITNSNNFINIPRNKISLIRAKYNKYKDEFIQFKFNCSICVLNNYIDKPEEAKAFLSEIFTKEQEEFYSGLEKWANTELKDKDCSNWLYSFLLKGRNLRIKRIKVFKYIGNEKQAKDFLLSKYEEKLNYEHKKKIERENLKKSIFDTFNDYSSSVNYCFCNLTKETKLYSTCISSNDYKKVNPISIMSSKEGINIHNDCIKMGIWKHLSLRATNPLFYVYTSTYKKYTCVFTFFSKYTLDIIKKYASKYLCNNLLEHTKACVVVRDFKHIDSPQCYTCFLTDDASLFCSEPMFHYNFSKTSNRFYHDIAGYRFVSKAMIWHLLKDKTESIDFSPTKDFSSQNKELILNIIQSDYNKMSFEDKCICHFIDTEVYKFPIDTLKTEQFKKSSFSHKILNLKNCITYQYDTKLLEDKDFPFAKIGFQYGDTTFKNLVVQIGKFINKDKYIDLWFDCNNDNFLTRLRTLFFLNWAYVSSNTGKIKIITACWLLEIVYNQYKIAYQKDKFFWRLLLGHVLIENENIFDTVIDNLILFDDNKDLFDINLDLLGIKVSGIVKALTAKPKDQF